MPMPEASHPQLKFVYLQRPSYPIHGVVILHIYYPVTGRVRHGQMLTIN